MMAMALVNVVGCELVVLPCCMRHKGLARRCSHGSKQAAAEGRPL